MRVEENPGLFSSGTEARTERESRRETKRLEEEEEGREDRGKKEER